MVRTQVFDSNIGGSFTVIIDRKKPLSELLNKKELNKTWKIYIYIYIYFFFFALQKNESSASSSHQNESKSEHLSVKSDSLQLHGL